MASIGYPFMLRRQDSNLRYLAPKASENNRTSLLRNKKPTVLVGYKKFEINLLTCATPYPQKRVAVVDMKKRLSISSYSFVALTRFELVT